jgi:hypothetical protein
MKTHIITLDEKARTTGIARMALITVIGLLAFVATGCTSVNYKPSVSLGMSPKTIKGSVKLETFVDASPSGDKSSVAFGVSTCEPGTLEGELVSDVTDAILTDFSNNQVFENIKKRPDGQPNYIVKGTIHRFYGKFGTTPVFWLTIPADILWLFGVPIMKDSIGVELEVSIERPDGTVIGNYRGQSSGSRWYNMYQNSQFALPTRTNKAFSESVAQIREQILKDEEKFLQNK